VAEGDVKKNYDLLLSLDAVMDSEELEVRFK
jgi:hypothetical protein